MRVIPPLAISDAMLTSSTAVEPGVGEAAWTSGATYALDAEAILGSPSATVTITIASPGVVTHTGHGLPEGTPVVMTTTVALPTGLSNGGRYFIINSTTNTYQLAATVDGAPIVTTGSQSGTHTATAQVHRRYLSQQASNTGHPPAIDDGTWWLNIGPTNRWAMFDVLRNTGTVGTSPMTIVLTPGQRVDALGLVGLVADSVRVKVTVAAVDVFDETRSLLRRNTTSWYEYFFGAFAYRSAVGFFELPPYVNGVITITLTRSSGNVTCGGLVLGTAVDLGETEAQAEDDALNFSIVERDDYGNSELIPRRSVPTSVQRVLCPKERVNKARALRDQLNATPALWSGLDDDESDYFEAVLILGVYKRFRIGLDHPHHAIIDLTLEEV